MIIRFYSHSNGYTGEGLTWGLSHIRLKVFELSMPMVASKNAFGRIFGVCTCFPGQDLSLKICLGNDHSRHTFLDLNILYTGNDGKSAGLGGSLGDIVIGTPEGFTPAKYELMEGKDYGSARSLCRTISQMPRILSCSDIQ